MCYKNDLAKLFHHILNPEIMQGLIEMSDYISDLIDEQPRIDVNPKLYDEDLTYRTFCFNIVWDDSKLFIEYWSLTSPMFDGKVISTFNTEIFLGCAPDDLIDDDEDEDPDWIKWCKPIESTMVTLNSNRGDINTNAAFHDFMDHINNYFGV